VPSLSSESFSDAKPGVHKAVISSSVNANLALNEAARAVFNFINRSFNLC
jgi:O-succinylbenzoate synthase